MSDVIGSFLNKLTEPIITPKINSKIALSNIVKAKLLSYQIDHVIRLVNLLREHSVALDNSDTGIGKTYIASAVSKEMDRRPIIICPKTLIFTWQSILAFFGVRAYDVINYETIRNGRTYATAKCRSRKKSPFVDILEPDPEDPLKPVYQWNLPHDAILIIDEGHRCKRPSTDNGKLLMSTKQLIDQKIPVLILSATICEKFADMKIPFYLFGFISNTRHFNKFVKTLKNKYPQYRVNRQDFRNNKQAYAEANENAQIMTIYEEIKDYSSRIKVKDLGDKFPSNQWCAQQFNTNEFDKIEDAYEKIAVHMAALKNNPGQNHLAQIQKLKQEIELRKVPIFLEQAQLYLDNGKSVIIFVNYLDTFHLIADELDIKCKIYGGQSMDERQEAIDLFQSNQERIIISQIRAGGTGISLHDIHGGHPRVTLINYPDAASDLLQALGRAARAQAKTPVIQRIIFVANVQYERTIMKNINRKLTNISAINDGDLNGYKYKIKKITRKVIKEKPSYDEIDHIEGIKEDQTTMETRFP